VHIYRYKEIKHDYKFRKVITTSSGQNRGRPPNPITVTFRVRFRVRNRVRARFRVRDRVRNIVRWSPTVLPKISLMVNFYK